jgi:hypothetical protein
MIPSLSARLSVQEMKKCAIAHRFSIFNCCLL